MEHVAVDLGYGFVKAVSASGKRILFPSLVGKGYDRSITSVMGETPDDRQNIHLIYQQEAYFVGELAKESRSVSRIFERERFSHVYTQILLNTAIQLVTEDDIVQVSTGLPLDFYQSQAKEFRQTIIGMQPVTVWETGPLAGQEKRINIDQAMVFPQGASAIFSALMNHEGKFVYPYLMTEGNIIALIDIGFRTTDFVVVEMQENGAFVPKAKLSGTIDEGVINLHRDIRQLFKAKTGGADLNESNISRVLKHEYITYKGQRIEFSEAVRESKQSIATNIADRLKGVWAEESDLFDAIFVAGGGGKLFESFLQPHFDNRLECITENQFANTIGYLRLGKTLLQPEHHQKMG
ncbi:ParM/StbA family protein [Lentibacillus sp. CBA3610]|uniref:ParM/StbA family protein n=1 Tax=Lentibacillus sp. CBA3610 TaxID=2518176 RepID=UPI0015951E61|nr:ParM/StbA family protein [Lentibacillus sp. CBA3610]QKY69434.1 ParM/StbA family protein [Lentibacillus sp. CBA3610]